MARYIGRKFIEDAILADEDDGRFEEFVADLFSRIERVDYETTARGGDGGTDAKAKLTLDKGVARICATTEKRGWQAKAESDIDKLKKQGRHIVRLRVCFSRDVKEPLLETIAKYGEKLFPDADVSSHSASGLTDLAYRNLDIFERNYQHEIAERDLWFQKADDEEESTLNLYRVALSTVFHPSIVEQRDAILENLVISGLEHGSKSIGELCGYIGEGLLLKDSPDDSYIASTLLRLQKADIVRAEGPRFRLSRSGHDRLQEILETGEKSSLDARGAFANLVYKRAGKAIKRGEFSKLWRAIQKELTHLFLKNGLRVVDEMKALADGEGRSSATPLITKTVDRLLAATEELQLNAAVEDHVVEVITSMFGSDATDASIWMREIGVKYLVICSLGLDPALQKRLRDRVKDWIIIPDTHVALSFICAGDEGHEACSAVLHQTKLLAQRVWALEPVLEETLHHASIAEPSFRDWFNRWRDARKIDPAVTPQAMIVAEDNAFVKGFAAECGATIIQNEWRDYMDQFLGSYTNDITSLQQIFESDLNANYIADTGDVRQAGAAYAKHLLRYEEENSNRTVRCAFDGRLLASCVVRRFTTHLFFRMLIVTESDRIRRSFRELVAAEKKTNMAVVDPAALAFSLASMPGSTVNLEAIKHFLFGSGLSAQDRNVMSELLSGGAAGTKRLLRRAAINGKIDQRLLGEDTSF